ncbi:IclR family transcriptional regulator C-terminal domain-containing protein [Streptomyces sp. NPDC057199]|uniref:IclR family transcriptional regulator domain-containing protein n=1 Tax=Streptomyces sp. NPDC057199 TaxID=3346047 RepID=UPI00363F5975
MSTEAKSNVSGSVFRALSLLEYVLGADTPTSTRELVERFSIPASSLAALLSALRIEGYLVSESGSVKPGTRLLALGQLAGRHELVANVRRALRLLADRTGETAFYSIEIRDGDGGLGSVLPVEQIESRDELRYVGILGRPMPLQRSMAGRAILAFSDREVEAREAFEVTDGAVAADGLLAELREIRRVGLAISPISASAPVSTMTVAAPVIRAGRVVGAFSIAGPAKRIESLEDDLGSIFEEAQKVVSGSGSGVPVEGP